MNGDGIRRIVAEIEYRRARRIHREQERPRFVVVHGYHEPASICLPGETIDRCHLKFPEREILIQLALPGLMLSDCLARHHHTPLSIARMERILASDLFYRRLGANACARLEEPPMFTRVSLRVYIARLREQIAKALRKGGSLLLPEEALVSESTDSNVVVHRIALPIEIVHSVETDVTRERH